MRDGNNKNSNMISARCTFYAVYRQRNEK